MPNLLAHSLLTKRLYVAVDGYKNGDLSLNHFLNSNLDFLTWGSFGPDPLFFLGILPQHGLHLLTAKKKIGNRLHKLDGRALFIAMIKRSYAIEDDKNRSRFQSFIFGQFAHYILDREAHGYILYMSGFDKDGKIHGRYHYLHGNFETNMDVALAKKFQVSLFLESPDNVIPFDKDFLAKIDYDFGESVKEALQIDKLPKHFYTNAISNMKSIQRSLNRSRKIKRVLLPKRIQAPIMPEPDALDYPDCLNEMHTEWKDPVTGEVHQESYGDISERCFRILMSCYEDILREGFNYEVFSRYIDGRDYYGTAPGKKWIYQKNPIK